MTCEPGKTYILEKCSDGLFGGCNLKKCKDCKERNRKRLECMGNAGDTDCINKCASWFPGNFSLTAACQAGCRSGERYLSMCDYLENYVGDQQTISLYGIDCDLQSGAGSQLVQQKQSDAVKYTLVAVAVVIVLFIIYLILS